jgi:tight adherence protein B
VSVLLAATLAGAAAAVLVALPDAGRLRLADLRPGRVRRPPWWRPEPVGVVLLAAPALLLAGPVAAALAVGVTAFVVRWRIRRRRGQDAAAERAGAVEACGVLAAELGAGRAPADALAAAAEVAAGPAREALRAAAAAAGAGENVGSTLAGAAPASAVAPLLRALGACWGVCATSGSGLAAAVQRLEEGLRADQAQRRAVDAELAGPRATAALLAVLPGIGLLMAAGLGADPLHVLLGTPLGLACLAVGLTLDGLGVLWTARLVEQAGGSG